ATYVERRKMSTFYNKAQIHKRIAELEEDKDPGAFRSCLSLAKKDYRRALDIYEKHFQNIKEDPFLQAVGMSYVTLVQVLKDLGEYAHIPVLLNKIIKTS